MSDGGLINEPDVAGLVFTDPEIISARLADLDEFAGKLNSLARWVAVALEIVVTGGLALCENGKRVAG